jgi:hypothetical protein
VHKEELGEGGEGNPPLPPLGIRTSVEAMANKTPCLQIIITTIGTVNMKTQARPIIVHQMIVRTFGIVGPTETIRGSHQTIKRIRGIILPSQCLASTTMMATVECNRGLEKTPLEMGIATIPRSILRGSRSNSNSMNRSGDQFVGDNRTQRDQEQQEIPHARRVDSDDEGSMELLMQKLQF